MVLVVGVEGGSFVGLVMVVGKVAGSRFFARI